MLALQGRYVFQTIPAFPTSMSVRAIASPDPYDYDYFAFNICSSGLNSCSNLCAGIE
jgi:hypothetical protein